MNRRYNSEIDVEGDDQLSREVHPTLRRFPLGAGSSGVRVYVTVRVTTCLTLTGRWPPVRGASKYRVLPSMAQAVGEKGERTAALRGESVAGE